MRPYVIALNGPPGIGKSWLTRMIVPLIPHNCQVLHFASPIREYIMASHGLENTDENYARFKEMRFWNDDSRQEMTGREEMIYWAEKKKAEDLLYWCKELGKHPFMNRDDTVIILDDLGFEYEQQWLQSNSSRLMTIVMAPSQYSINARWEGDSRFCLSPINGYRATDSNRALEIFKRRLDYAQFYLEGHIDDWFNALVAGPVGESATS